QLDHPGRRRVARRDPRRERYDEVSGGERVLPLHAEPRSLIERRREFRRADDRSADQLGRAAMTLLEMQSATSKRRLLSVSMAAASFLMAAAAQAAAPGITGPTFNLTARPAYITQPDGQMVYSWGYGCAPGST